MSDHVDELAKIVAGVPEFHLGPTPQLAAAAIARAIFAAGWVSPDVVKGWEDQLDAIRKLLEKRHD